MYSRLKYGRPGTARHGPRSRKLERYMVGRDRHRHRHYRTSFNSLFRYGPERRRPRCHDRDREYRTRNRDEHKEREERDKTPPAKPEEIAKELHVKSIDLHINKNSKRHNTDKYVMTKKRKGADGKMQDPELVIRRGQSFKMTVSLDRDYDKKQNDIKLLFRIGAECDQIATKGTAVQVPLDESSSGSFGSGKDWHAQLSKQGDKSIDIDVYIPPSCIIGAWDLGILTITDVKNAKDKVFRYDHPDDVYILLNPWCPEDTVYMSPEKLLDEYVLNDAGVVFQGNSHQLCAKAWNFSQFNEDILDICLHVIRKAFDGNVTKHMADPVRMSRAISQVVNCSDEDGILWGRWDGDYCDGTCPSTWCGSENILNKYKETKAPVKYGQCWVFSALTTTVCRAIGLPCRSVTNFSSAHDTDGSFSIDTVGYIDPESGDYEVLPAKSADSVWNFHVWNDVWMARPDLDGYDGWQAIDATPQESSGGLMQCGPAPLKAIKNGETHIPYDTGFIMAEVNADQITWLLKDIAYDCEILKVDKRSVGMRMSTKKPNGLPMLGFPSVHLKNNLDEEDVMYMYKYNEGTIEERRAIDNAYKRSSSELVANYIYKEPEVMLTFEDKDDIMVGSDFSATLQFKSRLPKKEECMAMVTIKTVTYTGVVLQEVKRQRFTGIELKPNESGSVELPVPVSEYLPYLSEHISMRLYGWFLVKNTVNTFTCESNFRLRRPDLVLKCPRQCDVGEKVDIEMSFTNPLTMKLKNCALSIEGGDIKDLLEQSDVGPKQEWRFKITVSSEESCNRQISAAFQCDEIPDISGVTVIEFK